MVDFPILAVSEKNEVVNHDILEENSFKCSNCQAIASVFWNKKDTGWLCNGCYLFYFRNGHNRPVDLSKSCFNCKTTSSLLRWKKGPDNVDLCESCGRHWEKTNTFLKFQCVKCNTTVSRGWRRDINDNYVCENCRTTDSSVILKASKGKKKKAEEEKGIQEIKKKIIKSLSQVEKTDMNIETPSDQSTEYSDPENQILSTPSETNTSNPILENTQEVSEKMTERQQVAFLLSQSKQGTKSTKSADSRKRNAESSPTSEVEKKRRKIRQLKQQIKKIEKSSQIEIKSLKEEIETLHKNQQLLTKQLIEFKKRDCNAQEELKKLNEQLKKKEEELERFKIGKERPNFLTPKLFFKAHAP